MEERVRSLLDPVTAPPAHTRCAGARQVTGSFTSASWILPDFVPSDPYSSEHFRPTVARLRIDLYMSLGFPLTVAMIVAAHLLIRGAVWLVW